MCGIVGTVDFRGLPQGGLEARLGHALDRLSLRGPDGRDTWADARCALGHTRLAIIDLSDRGAQPMTGHGRVIVQNGEIYNYEALRRELMGLGHAFATRSDTEVLLAGWREWGQGLLPRIVGMFAFALWDADAGELILARDRFGKKPLLYTQAGRRLTFGSDLLALERLDGQSGVLDPAALRLLFTLRFIPEPQSISAGVAKLLAGHLARFTAEGLRVEPWYDLAAARPARYGDEGDAAADLRAAFDASVAARTVADVPVGAFLSGGIDSAIVASSLARMGGQVRTFTVGFPDAGAYYEERPEARRIAEYLGTDHTEIELGPEEARAGLDGVFEGFDEPFADSSALPTYLLSQVTRQHVKVALSGDGADEVFGGYRKYLGELHAARYQRLPAFLRTRAIEPLVAALPESKDSALLELARRLRRFTAHAGKPAPERQAGWARLLGEAELDRLLAVPVSVPAPGVEETVVRAREAAGDTDLINAMLAAEVATGLVGDMLVKVDRMSMANGLEVRCPWLDQRVVECAAAMPGTFKLARGQGKRILRRAFAERLPGEVFARPKKGFEVPVARWLTAELRDLTRRAIDPDRLRRQGLFRPELPARWLADLESGRRDTAWALWTLVAFQSWSEHHRRLEAAA
jgi:asparagine synthase (glutamine-hydrolysing)